MQQVGRPRVAEPGATGRTEAARRADERRRRAARLGRKTRRIGRRMLVACGLAGVAAAAFLAYHHGDLMIARADQLVADIGLRADQVAVISKRSGVLDDVALADAFAAIAADGDGSIFSFDTAAARQRLQELPWVAAAEVRRVLPDGLEVVVEARSPIAVWQTRGMLFLVDATGHALSPVSPADRPDLPRVVGEGANATAKDIIALLAQHPQIAARLTAAVRVGDRRWTLELKNGPRLLLPADDPATALELVEELDVADRLLERAIDEVDLRIAGTLTLRLTAAADQQRRVSLGKRIAAATAGRGA